jgi:2'-5' RNA ligase
MSLLEWAVAGLQRIFVAVEIPVEQQQALGRLRQLFPPELPGLKWVAPELMHITIRFMGNLMPEEIKRVHAAATEAAASTTPFSIEVGGLGAFPSVQTPRVLWAGIARGAAELTRLHAALQDALVRQGFPADENRFVPHLTLARTPKDISRTERQAVAEGLAIARTRRWQPVDFKASGLTVMQSILERSGPTYLPVSVAPFSG